jgi:hypothetical protein
MVSVTLEPSRHLSITESCTTDFYIGVFRGVSAPPSRYVNRREKKKGEKNVLRRIVMKCSHWQAACCAAVLLSASGCVTNATTEVTEAPFVATTDITGGTTAAVGDITAAVTDFTSSTTPGAAGTDNPALAKKRLQLFTKASYDNLRFDISRGQGEYLVSLATLAGVPSAQVPQFQSLMQDSYGAMFDETLPVFESRAQIVDVAWASGYGRTQ